MRISIDAMGGDFAPQKIVAGTLQAATQLKGVSKLFLVGDESAIQAELNKYKGAVPECIEIVHASQVVENGGITCCGYSPQEGFFDCSIR